MIEFYIIVVFIVGLQCQSLPKSIQKCHFGDSPCIIKSINDVIRKNPRGLENIGIKPLDIVDVPDSELWRDAKLQGIWLRFQMKDQVNYGFENTTITHIKGFGKDPTASKLEIHGQIPSLVHKGKYLSTIRLWIVEMNSTGDSLSDFQNFRFALKFKVILDYRNNKRYLRLYELVPVISLDRWIISLDAFFNENSDLTIAINNMINENWVEFWNELEPGIVRTFSKVFTALLGDIFENIAYDDMFLPDDNATSTTTNP